MVDVVELHRGLRCKSRGGYALVINWEENQIRAEGKLMWWTVS